MEDKQTMKRILTSLIGSVVVSIVCCFAASGQVSTTGSISGAVTDPTGAVVANATVTAKNGETSVENSTTTSENGTFSIPQLQRGTYRLTILATSGFKKAEITNVNVNIGTPTTVNVVLELGTPQETVTIIGGGEVLQSQTANIGSAQGERFF
jgi:hypothetical protein